MAISEVLVCNAEKKVHGMMQLLIFGMTEPPYENSEGASTILIAEGEGVVGGVLYEAVIVGIVSADKTISVIVMAVSADR